MTAKQRRRMELVRRRTLSAGMASHSSCRAWRSSAKLVGGCCRALTLLSSWSHRCSMGFRSGDLEGHGSTAIPRFAKWSATILAVCGVAPSCMRVSCGWAAKRGTTESLITLSMYIWAFKFPWINTRPVFWFPKIPPQIITDPPLFLSASSTQFGANLSPLLLYTLTLPSLICKQKRDSSVKATSLHWRKVHLEWALVQARRARRCRGVSSTRWAGRWFLSPAERRRLRTVCPEMRLSPGIAAAVAVAGLNRCLGDIIKMLKNRLG